MAYLEEHAAHLRRGAGGAVRVPATGLVAASFTHHTSRAGDPALHSHVLVANMAQDQEGRFGALDGRGIYRHAQTAGYLYQAELRHQLTRSLGIEFGDPRKGAAEIEGVPDEVIRAFSTRRAQIEERMAERGQSSRRAAEMAALDTRQAKQHELSPERLRADWTAQAAELGFGAPASARAARPTMPASKSSRWSTRRARNSRASSTVAIRSG
jgi:conjugative relaxase-like TrwC/TraI family protein